MIGGFPPPHSRIHGGIVTECQLLLESSFARRFDLVLLDSTQRSIPEPGVLERGLRAGRRILRFVWLIERSRPDALVAFSSQGSSFIEKCFCAAYARIRGIPTVLLMRGGPFMDDVRRSRIYRRFARFLLRSATIIPCQGEEWRKLFHMDLGFADSRLPIIYNWTAPQQYLARPRRAERMNGPLQVLFLAWVDLAKGVFDLLDAAVVLWNDPSIPPFELHIAGGGAHLHELLSRVEALDRARNVIVHGWVSGSTKRTLFESADVFVLPSYAEGMPNSMIEAMSLAVPVVVTPVGAIAEVVRNGENGALVTPGDVESIARALGAFLKSQALRERVGRAGRETAARTFGLERGMDALGAAVERAMEVASQ